MSHSPESSCPVCRSKHWNVFFEMPEMPIFCNVFWPDQQSARNCSKGNIRLAFCSDCGFICNVAFEPARLEYTQTYENALDFSPRFQDYARSLATRLVKEYSLYKKDIIEIGCGKGEFLVSLCQLGHNRGVGFDPTYVELPEHGRVRGQVQFVRDLYSDQYSSYPSNFFCCRHTLEHVQDPISLIQMLRRAIGHRPNIPIFFEVPNGLDTFCNLAIWDIIYEHCCFFTPVSLSRAFSVCGFQIHKLWQEYQGQFLCIDAMVGKVTDQLTEQQLEEVKKLTADITAFPTNFQNKINSWQTKLESIAQHGRRAVVWGGGSKGVTFLNLLNVTDAIEYVVDINPRKQVMYVAGTGQRIVPPEFLQEYQPEVVFVMNEIYAEEIRQTLTALDLSSELMCV